MRRVPQQVKEDRRLAKRMLAGDEAAFEQFSNSYIPVLYRFTRRRLPGRRDLANDVVQSTLCKVIAKLHTYRGEATLVTWLCACCSNEIAAHFRGRSQDSRHVELDEEVHAQRAVDRVETGNPEQLLLVDERVELVHDVLDRLPPRYARALEMKYLQELPVKEIANRLGVSPKATESLLTRARSSFRAELTEEQPGFRSPELAEEQETAHGDPP